MPNLLMLHSKFDEKAPFAGIFHISRTFDRQMLKTARFLAKGAYFLKTARFLAKGAYFLKTSLW